MNDRTNNQFKPGTTGCKPVPHSGDWSDLGRCVLDAARRMMAREAAERAERLGRDAVVDHAARLTEPWHTGPWHARSEGLS